MRTPVIAIALTAALAVAACTGSDSSSSEPVGTDAAPPATDAAPATDAVATTEPAADTTTTIDPAEAQTIEQINAYVDEAAAFDQAAASRSSSPARTWS